MNMKKTFGFLAVGALALVTGLGVIGYRTVQAAAPQASTAVQASYGIGMGPGFRGGAGGVTDANLASALGISTTDLTTAYSKATDAALTQAVSKGLITQAQADQIRANGTAFPLNGRWIEYLTQNGIDYNSMLASALGISTDKLSAAYITAYNTGIDQAVTNGQLTQTQADLMKGEYALYNNKDFQTSMQSAFQAAVQKAVSAGVITQSQATQILQNQNNAGFPGLGGRGDFPGFGRHGGFGGGPGGGPANGLNSGSQGNPTTPTTPSAPSATPQGGA